MQIVSPAKCKGILSFYTTHDKFKELYYLSGTNVYIREQDSQFTYNVTMGCFREIIVAVEKQCASHIVSVCL